MMLDKQIFTTAISLIIAIVFFAFIDIDTYIQDLLFNHATQQWILDRHAEPYRFIFYDGIKKVLISFVFLMLGALIFFKKSLWVQAYNKGIIIVILSGIIVPTSVSMLKAKTNMPCPKHSIKYGGEYPHTYVWEQYPDSFSKNHTKCWPAGHASGGFALFSLFFLFKNIINRKRAVFFSLAMGWVMGGYKMLIGDHYFSHTFISMILSWLLILCIATAVNRFTFQHHHAELT